MIRPTVSMRKLFLTALLLSVPMLTGFDLSRHNVAPEDILSGGPPKDGIPAIPFIYMRAR